MDVQQDVISNILRIVYLTSSYLRRFSNSQSSIISNVNTNIFIEDFLYSKEDILHPTEI